VAFDVDMTALDPQIERRDLVLAVFGDSIANGLGAQGEHYPVLLAEHLGARLIDLTGTAAQVSDGWRRREEALGADIVLIAFGQTEGMVRPTARSLRFLPKRWRRPGWMDPRPYYSSRRWKRLGQRIESAIRWRVKVALIRLTGGTRWTSPEAYERGLSELVDYLQASDAPTIVIVSRLGQDERFFPGSEASLASYSRSARNIAEAKSTLFCDVIDVCRQWDDYLLDHFHPNRSGHRRIADHLISCLDAKR
jgi:lysophospholipase L1-like esterase